MKFTHLDYYIRQNNNPEVVLESSDLFEKTQVNPMIVLIKNCFGAALHYYMIPISSLERIAIPIAPPKEGRPAQLINCFHLKIDAGDTQIYFHNCHFRISIDRSRIEQITLNMFFSVDEIQALNKPEEISYLERCSPQAVHMLLTEDLFYHVRTIMTQPYYWQETLKIIPAQHHQYYQYLFTLVTHLRDEYQLPLRHKALTQKALIHCKELLPVDYDNLLEEVICLLKQTLPPPILIQIYDPILSNALKILFLKNPQHIEYIELIHYLETMGKLMLCINATHPQKPLINLLCALQLLSQHTSLTTEKVNYITADTDPISTAIGWLMDIPSFNTEDNIKNLPSEYCHDLALLNEKSREKQLAFNTRLCKQIHDLVPTLEKPKVQVILNTLCPLSCIKALRLLIHVAHYCAQDVNDFVSFLGKRPTNEQEIFNLSIILLLEGKTYESLEKELLKNYYLPILYRSTNFSLSAQFLLCMTKNRLYSQDRYNTFWQNPDNLEFCQILYILDLANILNETSFTHIPEKQNYAKYLLETIQFLHAQQLLTLKVYLLIHSRENLGDFLAAISYWSTHQTLTIDSLHEIIDSNNPLEFVYENVSDIGGQSPRELSKTPPPQPREDEKLLLTPTAQSFFSPLLSPSHQNQAFPSYHSLK